MFGRAQEGWGQSLVLPLSCWWLWGSRHYPWHITSWPAVPRILLSGQIFPQPLPLAKAWFVDLWCSSGRCQS